MNESAGDGAPYWYEWSIGLGYLVDSLVPEFEIKSVTIQDRVAQGWDDVVVRYNCGKVKYLQVKHTSVEDTFTFGDLLAKRSDGTKLITYLFRKWLDIKKHGSTSEVILYTNREPGNQGVSKAGILRPKIYEFFEWIKASLKEYDNLVEFTPKEEWRGAWKEFLDSLNHEGKDEGVKLGFLSSFSIEVSQPSLDEQKEGLIFKLSQHFGISKQAAEPLLNSLDSKLREWSSGGRSISSEDVYQTLVLKRDLELPKNIAPPAPVPFFCSREKDVKKLEQALHGEKPVVFVEGAPGSGKTALISKLCSKVSNRNFDDIISLRYFAFKPIQPNDSVVPTDSDLYVNAKGLWFTLLNELRVKLKGRLIEFSVPIRNNFLAWRDARKHVLEIVNLLGKQYNRHLTISIDGIDHAARSARFNKDKAKEFFDSFPSPSEIKAKYPNVKLLIAGQPTEYFSDIYPSWITDDDIEKIKCGTLEDEDILLLINKEVQNSEINDVSALLKIIKSYTNKNTLAVVFACNEIPQCSSIEAFEKSLKERNLSDGLHHYYSSIWNTAKGYIDREMLAETFLALALSVARETISPVMLQNAFKASGVSEMEWGQALSSLRPVIMEVDGGFTIRHNDLRIYLIDHLQRLDVKHVQEVASLMADYYINDSTNVRAKHLSLPSLLRQSKREQEWARLFDLKWVFESASILESSGETKKAQLKAFEGVQCLRDWNMLNRISIAGQALAQWDYQRDWDTYPQESISNKLNVSHLNVEGKPPNREVWSYSILLTFSKEIRTLVRAGELERAQQAFENWFAGFDLRLLIKIIYDEGKLEQNFHRGQGRKDLLMELSNLASVTSCISFKEAIEKIDVSDDNNEPVFQIEKGWFLGAQDVNFQDSPEEYSLGLESQFPDIIKTSLYFLGERQFKKTFSYYCEIYDEDWRQFSEISKLRLTWYAIYNDCEHFFSDVAKYWEADELAIQQLLPEEGLKDNLVVLFELGASLGYKRPGIDPREAGAILTPHQYKSKDWGYNLSIIIESSSYYGHYLRCSRQHSDFPFSAEKLSGVISKLVNVSVQLYQSHDAPSFRDICAHVVEKLVFVVRSLEDTYLQSLRV